MHSQMHSQTLAAFRAEISAVTTLQAAFNRVALSVDENSLAMWDGPRPEDVDDLAQDDGSFRLQAIRELREQAGTALAARFKEVERVIAGRAALESLLRAALQTGTGGVVNTDGPPPHDMLNALVRSGSLRLDWAQDAAHKVREVLDGHEATLPRPTVPASPIAKEGTKRTPVKKVAPKVDAPAEKKPVKSGAAKPVAVVAPAKKAAKVDAPAEKKTVKSEAAKKADAPAEKKTAAKPVKSEAAKQTLAGVAPAKKAAAPKKKVAAKKTAKPKTVAKKAAAPKKKVAAKKAPAVKKPAAAKKKK